MKNLVVSNYGIILLLAGSLTIYSMESREYGTPDKSDFPGEVNVQKAGEKIHSSKTITYSKLAQPIERANAYDMFMDYHGTNSTGPGDSEGCLKVQIDGRDSALTSVYLSIDSLINPLLNGVPTAPGEEIIGLAGIPAYNKSERSNTIIWVAVAEKADSVYYLLPPDSAASSQEYIYDYIDVCPDNCPKNRNRLWQADWKE